jgi:hypothetical protein
MTFALDSRTSAARPPLAAVRRLALPVIIAAWRAVATVARILARTPAAFAAALSTAYVEPYSAHRAGHEFGSRPEDF